MVETGLTSWKFLIIDPFSRKIMGLCCGRQKLPKLYMVVNDWHCLCMRWLHLYRATCKVKLSIIMYPCSNRVFQSSVCHSSETLETRCYSLLILVMVLTSDETLVINMLHGKGNISSISYHPRFSDAITGTMTSCVKSFYWFPTTTTSPVFIVIIVCIFSVFPKSLIYSVLHPQHIFKSILVSFMSSHTQPAWLCSP